MLKQMFKRQPGQAMTTIINCFDSHHFQRNTTMLSLVKEIL